MTDGFEMKQIGACTLYLADCMDVLPTLPKVDAVVMDPPYGIGEAAGKNKTRKGSAYPRDYGDDDWDNEPIPQADMDKIVAHGRHAIVFGGNYYAFPPSSCWLVWDKENGATDFADCELAWTNLPKAVRLIRYRWHGMLRKNNEPRGDHPTQKSAEVMRWCIGHLPDSAETILDPFMGSGTTGVACVTMGRRFIGIERERKYFDIACKRISEARRQSDLFVALPAEQVAMDL